MTIGVACCLSQQNNAWIWTGLQNDWMLCIQYPLNHVHPVSFFHLQELCIFTKSDDQTVFPLPYDYYT